MSDSPSTSDTLHAGDFGTWLVQARTALQGRGGMNVPCGECVGCCTSHYSILLRPHDAALDIVPAAVQSSVPGMWYPHAQMKPRANGHCPMFNAGRCSIYSDRPQTCLDYDCRVFAASGLAAGHDKPVINQRIQAWRFTYSSDEARRAHQAIQYCAAFIRDHADRFTHNWAPTNPAGIAVLAIKVYELFMDLQPVADPSLRATDILRLSRDFDSTARV